MTICSTLDALGCADTLLHILNLPGTRLKLPTGEEVDSATWYQRKISTDTAALQSSVATHTRGPARAGRSASTARATAYAPGGPSVSVGTALSMRHGKPETMTIVSRGGGDFRRGGSARWRRTGRCSAWRVPRNSTSSSSSAATPARSLAATPSLPSMSLTATLAVSLAAAPSRLFVPINAIWMVVTG